MLLFICLVFTLNQLAKAAEKTNLSDDSAKDLKSIEVLQAEAERGDAKAQFMLGLRCTSGRGITKDEVEAGKWYRKAAEQGYVFAQLCIGISFAEGRGVIKDYVEAVKWFRKAAAQGNARAQFELARCYAQGRGVEKDKVEVARWFRKAAEQGDEHAQYELGCCYTLGVGLTKDLAEAEKWYRKAADQGFAKAYISLGDYYFLGGRDYVEAERWYRKAAEQSELNAHAQMNLGFMYADGLGVTKDEVEAVKWLRKAADQGEVDAQLNLGGIYSAGGKGVPKDCVEAIKWYRKAADQGLHAAQNNLGYMYSRGEGVPKDYVEAVKWFRKAADLEFHGAQYNLGSMYADGQGVTKDYVEAGKWYRKAAEQGFDLAQYALGEIYFNGKGVPKDFVEAYKWLLLAAAQDNESASKLVLTLEGTMTREQMAEGQKLAREFKPEDKSQKNDITRENLQESNPEVSGSGFFITDDGYFITNQHVAGSGANVRIHTASGIIPAKVIKVDEQSDLTLLKAEGKFSELPVILSRGVQLGATVATVGFPNIGLQGFSPKLAKGEIASLAGIQDDARHFQISVPMQPGNSGGALVDERGNVIGVVVAKLSQEAALATSGSFAENVNYAIKSSYLLSFLESVPEVAAKLKEPNTMQRDFETTIKDVEQAAVLVLVY